MIGIFAAAIGFSLIMFLVEGVLTGRWDVMATQTFDLVRSAVLPIVTLVLGYYFGRSTAHELPRRDESDAP